MAARVTGIVFHIGTAQHISLCIVSVLHQNEGGIGKSTPDAQEISRDPRDVPRVQPEGHLEGRGKSRGQIPIFGGVRPFYSSSGSARENPSL